MNRKFNVYKCIYKLYYNCCSLQHYAIVIAATNADYIFTTIFCFVHSFLKCNTTLHEWKILKREENIYNLNFRQFKNHNSMQNANEKERIFFFIYLKRNSLRNCCVNANRLYFVCIKRILARYVFVSSSSSLSNCEINDGNYKKKNKQRKMCM